MDVRLPLPRFLTLHCPPTARIAMRLAFKSIGFDSPGHRLDRFARANRLLALLTVYVLSPISLSPTALSAADDVPSKDALDFFENRIRPVLIEHCYECHSAEAADDAKLQGGLFVDSAPGLLTGGDSGAAIVAGDPDASLLIQAMRFDSFEMPPQGKLSDQILADFEHWIQSGAADPRLEEVGNGSKREIDMEAARRHWAYQPLRAPELTSRSGNWDSPIDTLIARQWQTEAAVPADRADQRTLVRRLYFDLTGLPPTPEQIQAFLLDDHPNSVERLVDQLICSPHFGERWGRHWLDLVRFAESVTLRGLVQHQAWRYRDYVINAFNNDLSYDQFLLQQVAGDIVAANTIRSASFENTNPSTARVSLTELQWQHIATTFLTLGNNNLEDQDKEKLRMDAVDEQLNVIGSAILGQTIGCARCHDHKFDPIPTSDYYALAGILRGSKTLEDSNVSNWIEQPLPVDPHRNAEMLAFQERVNAVKEKISFAQSQLGKQSMDAKSVDLQSLAGQVLDNANATLKGQWEASEHSPRFVGQHYLHDAGTMDGKKSAQFTFTVPENGQYEVRLSYSPGANRSTIVHVAVQDFLDNHTLTINQQETPTIDRLMVSVGQFRFDKSTPGSVTISNFGANGHVIVDAVQILPIQASVNATSLSAAKAASADAEKLKEEIEKWKKELAELNRHAPEQPKYMAIVDEPDAKDIAIHIRGTVHQYGATVSRGFLSVVPIDCSADIPEGESGRLQLGRWLADSGNPLPARVMANRIWLWLLGDGLVRSPDNFGTTGQAPTHPELLDYLALRLLESKGSIKSLVREIVLSETYQRSSLATEPQQHLDPENQLWLRQNRKRLPVESMVDTLLTTSGQLDLQAGGKTIPDKLSADYGFEGITNRRAVYWPVLRNAIPDLIQVFDGADPSLVTGRRNTSTVASQALVMMNNPWVIAQCRAAGERFAATAYADEGERVDAVFVTILGRLPNDAEKTTILQFCEGPRDADASQDGAPSDTSKSRAADRWSQVIQSLCATIDFRYLH